MLGSAHDAEDLVQETYLRAWRARGQYYTLQIFTVTDEGIGRNSVFQDPGVHATFGLAARLDGRGFAVAEA